MFVKSIFTRLDHCSIIGLGVKNYSKNIIMTSTSTERLKTLQDPKTKYPLKLMEKIEVSPGKKYRTYFDLSNTSM